MIAPRTMTLGPSEGRPSPGPASTGVPPAPPVAPVIPPEAEPPAPVVPPLLLPPVPLPPLPASAPDIPPVPDRLATLPHAATERLKTASNVMVHDGRRMGSCEQQDTTVAAALQGPASAVSPSAT
jgi:hypothetical protein